MPCFPDAFPGETLYSLICRYACRSGISKTDLINNISGQKHIEPLLSALPGYISYVSNILPANHPLKNVEIFVKDHTNLLYFVYFHQQNVKEHYLKKLISSKSPIPVCLSLGMSMYKNGTIPKHPRYCIKCIENDINIYGVPYFHREHQLPAVSVCWKHETTLMHGCETCGLYPIKRNPLLLPGCCNCENAIKHIPSYQSLPLNNKILFMFAKQSASLLTYPAIISDSFIREFYEIAAKKYSYNNFINYKKIAYKIIDTFGFEFIDWIGYPVLKNNEPAAWLCRLLINPQKKKQTIQYLILIISLFESVEHFLNEMSLKRNVLNQNISKTENTIPPNWLKKLEELIATGRTSLTYLSRKLNIPKYTIITSAIKHEIKIPLSNRTINLLGLEKVNSIINDLKKGLEKTAVYKKYKCSEWAIILIELDNPGLNRLYHKALFSATKQRNRNRLLEFLAENHHASRRDLQISLPSVFDYFMKHDFKWFSEQLPLKPISKTDRKHPPRVDWDFLDNIKSKEIEQIADSLKNSEDRPVWLTFHGLLKRANIISKYISNSNKFPNVKAILDSKSETYSSYVERKINWAIHQIVQNGDNLSLLNLRLTASLPVSIINNFLNNMSNSSK